MTPKPNSILVVDDEVDTCANLSDIFTELGFQVDVAHDGLRALELVRKRHYDIALLDLKMPGMDGLELYRRIKELRAGTVAMIVTAYATDATAQAALDAGAWRVISKPVDPGMLWRFVEQAMDQPLVMIIDDDPDLCDSLWDLLRENSFRACVAHSLDQAAEMLKETDLNVALIDMRLPKGNGQQLFELVRETNPQARTIVITGYRSETEQLVTQVLAAGADAVCYKPFDIPTLLETVNKLAK
jgi:two-component system, NtrC family, response regulator HydG